MFFLILGMKTKRLVLGSFNSNNIKNRRPVHNSNSVSTATDAHASAKHRPGVSFRIVHLNRAQIGFTGVTSDDVE